MRESDGYGTVIAQPLYILLSFVPTMLGESSLFACILDNVKLTVISYVMPDGI